MSGTCPRSRWRSGGGLEEGEGVRCDVTPVSRARTERDRAQGTEGERSGGGGGIPDQHVFPLLLRSRSQRPAAASTEGEGRAGEPATADRADLGVVSSVIHLGREASVARPGGRHLLRRSRRVFLTRSQIRKKLRPPRAPSVSHSLPQFRSRPSRTSRAPRIFPFHRRSCTKV